MIEKLIEWSLRNRFLVLCATLLLVALGVRAVYLTPVDAIPDLTENQVLVYADWMGRSPQEVEDQVTFPLSTGLQGLAGVKEVRATSMFGFSLVTIIFQDQTDTYFARSRVLERLNFLQGQMPAGVTPQLGPDATGLGWVYQYYLHVDPNQAADGGYDLAQLRSLQDWKIRYDLASVQGVAEVASIGGFVKQYQIELSSTRMRAAGVSLMEVMTAVQNSNLNVGGKTLEENGAEFVLRGIGLITNTQDLELVTVKAVDGTPIYLKDIATIQIGGDYRRGALDINGHEAVGGTVVMRSGENAKAVIERIKQKIAEISSSLPPGVTIRPFYDRSDLIDKTIDTLKHALIEEIVLVTLAHILFLWHFRSILIVTLPLPISILVSFLFMKEFGITSNIMSLTGIAIAIGVLVDAAIVVTENVIRHCESAETTLGRPLTAAERWQTTLSASKQVGRPIFFAMAIILLAFVPVFALTGQEGKLFHPLAFTKTFAMIGATVLGVTLVPVLCSFLVKGPYHAEDRHLVMRFLMNLYEPSLSWALKHPKSVVGTAMLLLASSLLMAFGLPKQTLNSLQQAGFVRTASLFQGFGKEFMPPLREGSLLHMPVLLPKTGFKEIQRVMSWQDEVMAQIPEIETVAGKLGRFETATDPAPTEMLETTIMLKPEFIPDGWFFMKRNPAWREGMTVEKLKAELTENGKLRSYVQANVQNRDIGSFVQEVEQRLKTVPWQGMTYQLTGEYENQKRFTQTMIWVFPLVLLIIFVLLFMVFRSGMEAAHVMLAVPFALSGGVILQKCLGYHFNGAVWVGYIALFGTAVQTGVVMVVYLEETLKDRMATLGDAFNRADLMQSVIDGAKLRLRPKVMTVATTVASLLPIMWSSRQGAEVMKPLATPVIGGMISSILHSIPLHSLSRRTHPFRLRHHLFPLCSLRDNTRRPRRRLSRHLCRLPAPPTASQRPNPTHTRPTPSR